MKRKLLAVMMAVCMTASFAGGTATVFASSEASDTKTEVIIGFSGDGDSFDPCTGFGYTGSPLYSNLVKVNGEVATQRGKKLHAGDVVSYDGETIKIEA